MSCYPTYSYRPTYFEPMEESCVLLTYHRERSTGTALDEDILNETTVGFFFRSKVQSLQSNDIILESNGTLLKVIIDGEVVEQFSYSSAASLRAAITIGSAYIEMPVMDLDYRDDERESEEYDTPFSFNIVLLGANGPPLLEPEEIPVLTGPSRAMINIASYEDEEGLPIVPPPEERILQWNGEHWISYINLVQGDCPIDGSDPIDP